jgi:hypothetical protein
MPLTSKGNEIKNAMTKEYGAKKGEEVFYASKNAGKISGVDSAENKAMSNQTPGLEKAFDALNCLMDDVKRMKSRVDARCDAGKEDEKARKINQERDLKTAREGGDWKWRKKLNKGERKDAIVEGSREFHELAAGHAKKTAQSSLDAGDPATAKKWVDYGSAHTKKMEEKTPAEKAKTPPK